MPRAYRRVAAGVLAAALGAGALCGVGTAVADDGEGAADDGGEAADGDGDDSDDSGYGAGDAEDDTDDADDPAEAGLEAPAVVVTPDRSASTAFLSRRSIFVAGERLLLERPPRTVPSALIDAGAFVQHTNHGGGAPILRGLIGPSVLVLIDGIRLNDSTTRTGPNQSLATIDPWSVRRIEVMHGPGSVLYGAGALGGVVHVLTRSASADNTFGVYTPRLAGRYDTADTGIEGRAEMMVEHFGVGALVGFSGKRFGDLRTGHGLGLVPFTGYREWDLDWKLTVGVLNGIRLDLAGQIVRAYDVPRTDACLRGPANCVWFTNQFRTLWYATFRVLGRGFIDSLEITTSLHKKREVRDTKPLRDSPPTLRERDDVWTPGLTARLDTSIGEHHLFAAGLDAYFDLVRSHGWDYSSPGSPAETRGRYPDKARYLSLEGYGHWEWLIGRRLTVDAGGRVSGITAAAPDDAALGVPIRYGFVGAVLEAGASWLARDDVNLVLTVAQGFRPPNWDDIAALGPSGRSFDLPSPGLGPERALTIDFGPKVASRVLSFSLTGYVSRLTNLIVRVPATCPTESVIMVCPPGAAEVDGLPVSIRANASVGFIAGVEAAAEVLLGPGWRAFGSAVWTWGEAVEPNVGVATPLSRVPPLFGALGVGWSGARGRAFADVTLRWALAQRRLSASDFADRRICPSGALGCEGTAAFAVLSAHAGWELIDGVRATFTLENIGDTPYRIHGSGVAGAGASAILGLDIRTPF